MSWISAAGAGSGGAGAFYPTDLVEVAALKSRLGGWTERCSPTVRPGLLIPGLALRWGPALAKDYRERLARQYPRLLRWLGQESWDSLTRAQGAVQQMREGVFPSDLLEAAPPEIDCGPALVYANERIQFRVKFQDPRFDMATARYDLQAIWDFGDGLSESGWETSHYYPWCRWGWRGEKRFAAYSPIVTFTFHAPEQPEQGGKWEASATPKVLQVQSESSLLGLTRDRNRVEVLRFVLALLPAVFGMVAGAKEQLLKTDLMTGIMGVLLLGFGSDTIKNLVSKSQQPTAPAPEGHAGPPAGSP